MKRFMNILSCASAAALLIGGGAAYTTAKQAPGASLRAKIAKKALPPPPAAAPVAIPAALPEPDPEPEVPLVATLKSEAIVNADVVRLSDLIENAGPRGDIPIFRAPDLGQIGTIQTPRILVAAKEQNLGKIDTRDLSAVVVRRPGHIVPMHQLQELISDALHRRYGLPTDIELVIDKAVRPMIVEAEARRTPQLSSFIYESQSGRFEATISVPGSELTAKAPYRFSGALGDFVRVAVVIRNLNKGDTIGANDISIEKRKRSELYGEVMLDPVKVAGQIARRSMHSGDIIGNTDINKAEWVERGASVTLVYEAGGLSLTTKGKAVTGGTEGDSVSILNPQSKRVVDGTIIAPGTVKVIPKNVEQILSTASNQNQGIKTAATESTQ